MEENDAPFLEEVFHIYGLVDPRTKKVCYIGQTGRLRTRYLAHVTRSQFSNPPTLKEQWIAQLLDLNLLPDLVILSEVPAADASSAEAYWINVFKSKGFELVNGAHRRARPYWRDSRDLKGVSLWSLGETATAFGTTQGVIHNTLMLKGISSFMDVQTRELWVLAEDIDKIGAYIPYKRVA